MRIMKFGGTSVQNAVNINKVIDIVTRSQTKKVIIVSAFATITNALVKLSQGFVNHETKDAFEMFEYIKTYHLNVCKDLSLDEQSITHVEGILEKLRQMIPALATLGDVTPRSTDLLLSFGEILSSFIIQQAFLKRGQKCNHIDARTIMKTDSNYSCAAVDWKLSESAVKQKLEPMFETYDIVLTSGFIGSNKNNDTTTLGRGGSDFSASIFAVLLNAESLEIWTDVSGVMSCDPRIVKNVRHISELTYAEAAELAFFGAKVLHPKTIRPAVRQKIPILIKNTFEPDHPGTKIWNLKNPELKVKAIAFQKMITVINVYSDLMLGTYGFLSKIFDVFTRHKVSVDVVTTSEVNVSLTIDRNNDISDLVAELSEFSDVTVDSTKSLISVIGEGIKNTPGIASRFFNVLREINIFMVTLGASEVNLSVVVDELEMEKAIKLLHEEFFSDQEKK